MSSTKGPGRPLGEDERLAAQVGDAIDELEGFALIVPGLENVLATLCWVKRRLEEGFDPETGARL